MSIESTKSHIVLVKVSNLDTQRFTFDGTEVPAMPVKLLGDGVAYMAAFGPYFKDVKLSGMLECGNTAASELFGLEIFGLVYKKCLHISNFNHKWSLSAKTTRPYILRVNINLADNIISAHRKIYNPFHEPSIRSRLMQYSHGTAFEATRSMNGSNEWYLKPQAIKEQVQDILSHAMSNKTQIIEDQREYERHTQFAIAYSLRSFANDSLYVDKNSSQVRIFKVMLWNQYQDISESL